MSDITGASILNDYIINRSNIRKYFALEDLQKLIPDVSIDVQKKIYQNILAQQEAKYLKIKNNIKNDYDLPLTDLITELNGKSNIGKRKFTRLVTELEKLNESINVEGQNLDDDIKSRLAELKELINKLDQVKVDSDAYYNQIIQESIEKCDQLSSLMDII
ncbi:unnamed protein product [Candida verbasci]|uniref:Uncharacterized protein n=1 Tax=Candida verbasci TaxID=1227364 RepID=A0A9W4TTE1_9ASCO|nr:unnamed protein product [Candida verbasci]